MLGRGCQVPGINGDHSAVLLKLYECAHESPGILSNAGFDLVHLENLRVLRLCVSDKFPQSTLRVARPRKISHTPEKDDQW